MDVRSIRIRDVLASRFSAFAPALPVTLLALLAPACGGSDAPASAEDVAEADPFPSTIVAGESVTSALREFRADGTLVFDGEPALLAEVGARRVLILQPGALAPNGGLRAVLERSVDGEGNLILRTVPAPVQLAFRRLHVQLAPRTIDRLGERADLPALRPAETLGGMKSIQYFIFNADGDESTEHDQARIYGDLAGYVTYTFGMDVDWGDVGDLPGEVWDCISGAIAGDGCSVEALLPEVKIGYGIDATASATVNLAGAAFAGFQKDFVLAKFLGEPILIPPFLAFFPEVKILAHVEGGASSSFDVGTAATVSGGMLIQ